MHRTFKRVLSGVAALAVVGVTPLITASAASASPTLGAGGGVATVKTSGGAADLSSGDANDVWTLRLPAGAVCATDGNAGGRWHTFMVPASENLNTALAFSGTGALVGASTGSSGTGTFRNNILGSNNTAVRNQAPNAGDAAIINIPNMAYNGWTAGQIPSGAYKIGIACTHNNVPADTVGTPAAVDNYWFQTITVTYPGGDVSGAQINWIVGQAPNDPTGVTVASGNQTCVVSFTPSTQGSPAPTYTATATGPGGPFSNTSSGSPITVSIPGGNNQSYTVAVQASNTAGSSSSVAASNNPCIPVAAARNNVSGLTATPGAPGSGIITLNWTPPAANTPAANPASYAVSWTGQAAGSASPNVPFGTNTYQATGLAAGTYTFTVTAVYADNPTTGTPAATVQTTAAPSSLLYQDIAVNRPVGALVITQVCGVHGAQNPVAPALYTGFPDGLPAITNANSSTVEVPTLAGTAPTTGAAPGGPADTKRGQYPYPTDANGVPNPSYPTHCGVDLGIAQYVTRGTGAGQFFAASGVLNQVTVVDTRDDDIGFNVNGTMGQFSANGGTDVFSGSQLGWIPKMTEDTGPFADSNGATYDQDVHAGPAVAPNTVNASGLSSGRNLANAAAGSGLGTAILDARLLLLIPVTADAGNYAGTLTISAA